MTDLHHDSSALSAAHLLRGASALFAVLGLSFLVWVWNQWAEHPEMRASQFGFEAPLWPALGGFVLIAIAAVVGLFWSAAHRVETGENLFAQRHRRQSSEWDEPINGSMDD